MKAVYIGSFDPPHFGHKNTYEKAIAELKKPVDVAICTSPLKENSMFSLAERQIIAKDIFKNAIINLYESREQIINLLNKYDLLVRGYYCESDIEYVKKLLEQYNCENKFASVYFIKIDDDYKEVSSSKIKESALVNAEFSKEYLSDVGYKMLMEKLGDSKC